MRSRAFTCICELWELKWMKGKENRDCWIENVFMEPNRHSIDWDCVGCALLSNIHSTDFRCHAFSSFFSSACASFTSRFSHRLVFPFPSSSFIVSSLLDTGRKKRKESRKRFSTAIFHFSCWTPTKWERVKESEEISRIFNFLLPNKPSNRFSFANPCETHKTFISTHHLMDF